MNRFVRAKGLRQMVYFEGLHFHLHYFLAFSIRTIPKTLAFNQNFTHTLNMFRTNPATPTNNISA